MFILSDSLRDSFASRTIRSSGRQKPGFLRKYWIWVFDTGEKPGFSGVYA